MGIALPLSFFEKYPEGFAIMHLSCLINKN